MPNLLRHWPVRIGCAILGIVGALAVAYVLSAQTLEVLHSTEYGPFHGSFVVLTEHVLGLFGGYAHQIIGVFGWLDTPSPLLVTFVWTSLVGFLADPRALGVEETRRVGADRPHRRSGDRDGGGHRVERRIGRHHLAGPGWITPLRRRPPGGRHRIPKQSILGFGDAVRWRLAAVLAIAVGVSQLVDFVWTLRRYTVGLGKTVNLFQPVLHGWSPPPGTRLWSLWERWRSCSTPPCSSTGCAASSRLAVARDVHTVRTVATCYFAGILRPWGIG